MRIIFITFLLFLAFGVINLYSQTDYSALDQYVIDYNTEISSLKEMFVFLDSVDSKFTTDLEKTRILFLWLVKIIFRPIF